MIQAGEQRHRFSALACRPLHQKRLGQEFMRLQSTHIRIPTFWDYPNNDQVILFQIHNKLPASLEINSQRIATCLAHAFVFLEGLPTITSIVEGFGGVRFPTVGELPTPRTKLRKKMEKGEKNRRMRKKSENVPFLLILAIIWPIID